MEYHQLRYFLEVAETGNITKAASQLYISQPALSKQLTMLEKECGAKLFTRSKYGVTLTNLGQELLPKAQAVVHDMESVQDFIYNLQDTSLGTRNIKIAIDGSLLRIPSIRKSFLATTDKLRGNPYQIDITFWHSKFDDTRDNLINGRADIGISALHDLDLANGLNYCVIYVSKMYLYYAKTMDGPHSTSEIASFLQKNTILHLDDNPLMRIHMNTTYQKLGVTPREETIVGDVYSAFTHAANEEGILILPKMVFGTEMDNQFISIPLPRSVPPYYCLVLWREQLTPAIQKFIREFASEIRKQTNES